jgi:hypothetical protein
MAEGTFWRVVSQLGYRNGMRRRSARPERMEPERRLSVLDDWAGMWVAVKDGKVIAAAHNSRDLVPELEKLGREGKGAVAQYVPYPSDSIMIGVG